MTNKDQLVWNAYNELFLSEDTERLRKVIVRYDLFCRTQNLPGDIIECGVFKGVGLFQWLKYLAICDPGSNKKVIGFDYFNHFEEGIKEWEKKSVAKFVKEAKYGGVNPDELMKIARKMRMEHRFELIKGNACDTIPQYVTQNRGMRISLLHMDFDVYESTLVALKNFWPIMVRGGIVILDEYSCRGFGESEAVDEFLQDKNIKINKVPNSYKPSGYIVKS